MTEIGQMFRSNGIDYKVVAIDGNKVLLKDVEIGSTIMAIDGYLDVSGFRPVRQTVRQPHQKVLSVNDDGDDVWI
jgi:hypothetical protein